jgi:hypothetical protein
MEHAVVRIGRTHLIVQGFEESLPGKHLQHVWCDVFDQFIMVHCA